MFRALRCIAVYCSALQSGINGSKTVDLPTSLQPSNSSQCLGCCAVLQRVAVYCAALQCVAVYCAALQCVAVCCRAASTVSRQWICRPSSSRPSNLSQFSGCCSVLQCVAERYQRSRESGSADLYPNTVYICIYTYIYICMYI